jgi:multidrug efflux pump subunit AcrA (membrane-fusion protein)
MIRSFTYQVPPYISAKPKAATPVQQPKQQLDPELLMQGQGGRGGGRGGRGGGPGNMMMEKPGATRIVFILPEGTHVKAGDIVCELDSAAFKDELQAQKIRYLQAKSQVEQVQAILDVTLITLREYRDGIFPQDRQLIRQYLSSCTIDEERARKNLDWSKQTAAKGYRSPAQVMADELAHLQSKLGLDDALGMAERLEKFTAPRLIKNLEAKIEAIRADKLSQEATFQLESDRKRKLETMIEHCTLRAPREGIVVYAKDSNPWGRLENQIQEGVTVREGQPIFQLPDPSRMRVKARVNESKVASIQTGQRAEILVDAFADKRLLGTVTEVTPIAAPSNGLSDVKFYFVYVNIDSEGFDGLRPGLSAEVTFKLREPRRVTRVPVQAIRWYREKPYVAVASAEPRGRRPNWQWRPLDLGQSDAAYAEVVSGLMPGERVAARPELLPPPRLSASTNETASSVPDRPRG